MFVEPPELEISINVNNPSFVKNGYVIALPDTLDLNPDDTVTMNLDSNKKLPNFVLFDNSTNFFAIKGFTEEDIGDYEVILTLVDSQGGTAEFEFAINLFKEEVFQGIVIEQV